MNARIWMHVLGAIAAALAGGTIVFAGLDDSIAKNIAALASLIGIAINAYLGGTTTGVSKNG